MGRYPGARLSAHSPRGRQTTGRCDRQLRWRDDDNVVKWRGTTLDDGRTQLLRDNVSSQHGERIAAGHGTMPAPSPRTRSGPCRLSGGSGSSSGHYSRQGTRLLRRPRIGRNLRAVAAAVPPAGCRRQRRPVCWTDRPWLLAGESRSHVFVVQPGHGALCRRCESNVRRSTHGNGRRGLRHRTGDHD